MEASLRDHSVLRTVASRVVRFALVSGVGLALDMTVFLVLTAFDWRAGVANFLSAACGATFVYFVSTKRIFRYQGSFLYSMFLVYLAYQACSVTLASWAVDFLVTLALAPIVAKSLILPVTFLSNFAFMTILTHRRRQS